MTDSLSSDARVRPQLHLDTLCGQMSSERSALLHSPEQLRREYLERVRDRASDLRDTGSAGGQIKESRKVAHSL